MRHGRRRPASPERDNFTPAEDAAGAKDAGTSGSAQAAFGSAGGARAQAAPPPVAWMTYRVAVVIEAPSGRRYAVDTLRTGPQADAGER